MTVFMIVTRDKYELPLYVADSVEELSKMTGRTKNSLGSCFARRNRGYVKVTIDDYEE